MGLGFLVPLALMGLAAIVIPIVVHLREKQRKNVVDFPSLMFLHRIPFRSVQKRKIRHWFLMSARALAIILIVAAFARPFFDDDSVLSGRALGPTEVVILVDRSYSMDYGDRWERAKEAVRQRIAGLDARDRATLIFFDRGAWIAARSVSDQNRLRNAIDSASVGAQLTRYGPGLKLAQSVLDESELPNLEAVIVSDFQRAGWTGDEAVSFPAGTSVLPIQITDPEVQNAAIASLTLRRDFFQGRERMTPTARIVRSGGDAQAELPVTLSLDGQVAQTRTVGLDATGASTVTFQPFTLVGEFTRGRIALGGDALAADDELNFVLSPGRALSVLVLEGSNNRSDASLFLRQALSITEDASFEVDVRASSTVTENDLSSRAVIVVNDTRFPTGVSAQRLRRFVEGGGGLLVALGERATWSDDLVELLPGRFGPAVENTRGGSARLGFLEYGHPALEIFSGPRSGDFSRARFFRSRPLTLFSEGRLLARFADGSVALAERRVGEGRVIVWASTLDAFWNDLALQPVFLPFMHELARHLGGHRERVPWFTAGQVLDLSDSDVLVSAGFGRNAELSSEEERVALAPGGGTVRLPAGDGPRYLDLRESGFYEIRPPGSEERRPFTVAVNVDIAESELGTMDPAELAAAVSPREEATRAGSFGGLTAELQAETRERRQALWRFLLLGALMLLVAETIASNWLSRSAATTR